MSQNKKGFSRRDFIKGGALVGASMASLGALASCAPQTQGSNNANEAQAATGANVVSDITWDKEVDTLVVGSGTAAWGTLAAKDAGDESVLIIDKANHFGGTSSFSGAAMWIPVNYVEEELGIEDNAEDALTYLKNCCIGEYGLGGHTTVELLQAHIDTAPKFIEWTRDTYGFAWHMHFNGVMQDYTQVEGYRPKGRSLDIEVVESYKNIKGETYEVKNPFELMGPATWDLINYLCDKNGVEIMLETEGVKLYQDESGAVVGMLARTGGKDFNISAKKIIMGTGGFDHNAELRNEFLRIPMMNTTLVPECTGDGHLMGMEIGAKLDNMASYFGAPVYLPEGMAEGDGALQNYMITEHQWRSSPGTVAVNKKGERVCNECMPYATFARTFETYDSSTFDLVNLPVYIISDSTYAERYTFPFEKEVGTIPDWVTVADTLEELAGKLDIDPDGLAREMTVFNQYAAEGIDPKFHRGEFFHDQLVIAPAVGRDDLINPVFASVEVGPFYAASFWPGLHGTSGGLKVNTNAQVLDMNDEVIPNLYAAGCCSASASGPTYVGGGTPVGWGSVRAWVAGSHKGVKDSGANNGYISATPRIWMKRVAGFWPPLLFSIRLSVCETSRQPLMRSFVGEV